MYANFNCEFAHTWLPMRYANILFSKKLQVAYISFSAHTDYKQTSGFIRALKPPHVVLVHGEANEMNRLKAALVS